MYTLSDGAVQIKVAPDGRRQLDSNYLDHYVVQGATIDQHSTIEPWLAAEGVWKGQNVDGRGLDSDGC